MLIKGPRLLLLIVAMAFGSGGNDIAPRLYAAEDEAVTDASVAASDGSAFATPGPVWHKKDKEAGIIPEGLHGVDTQADWIQSTYHGWVYGYKAHVSISVAPTTVRVVLGSKISP